MPSISVYYFCLLLSMSSDQLDSNISQYVEIMSKRASGELPEMGSAKMFAETVKTHCCTTDSPFKLLDVGCAKGFMLYDLKLKIPGLKIQGIDISKYAIENSKEDVRKYLSVANATNLPFPDNSFDVVISINTIHNLDEENCGKALKEISRVSKKNSFITVDAYRNDIEREQMFKWNLTAKTIMSVEKWKEFFKKHNYNGDYYWFIP